MPLIPPFPTANFIDTAKASVEDLVKSSTQFAFAKEKDIVSKQDAASKEATQVTPLNGQKSPPTIPKSPKLSKFISTVKNRSVSRQSHFYTVLPIPNSQTGWANANMMEEISLYIEQAALPELAIATMPSFANGLAVEMPYDKAFGSTVWTFVCDQNMVIKSFFDRWINSTMQTYNGVFSYRDNYVVPELPLVITDAALNPVYMVVLYEAYPKLINDVYLASSERDYNRVQVQFTYSHWRSYLIQPTPQNVKKASSLVPGSIREFASKFGIDFNFDSIPGIDQIGLGNVLDVLGAKDKKSALKKQGKGILSEFAKPYKEKVMDLLPGQVKQLGGSALGKFTKGWL